ncbi:MAG: hypothetical protein N3H30_01365 [Candidatus Micrarchaeota archaeon]|nr:hypothetical protein [Candidatus Micrarchaeota archaeon]
MASQGLRGQAAMEYLMTYGWALIAIVVVLSVLYSVGVFDPQQYMSEECMFQPSLQCKSMQLSKQSGTFTLILHNGLGYRIIRPSGKITFLSTGQEIPYAIGGEVGPNAGIQIEVTGVDTSKFRAGTIEKARIALEYGLDGRTYTTTGSVSVRVSP